MDAPILPPNRTQMPPAPGSSPSSGHDPFDALADLFLGPPARNPSEPPSGATGGTGAPLRLVGTPGPVRRAESERVAEVVVARGGRVVGGALSSAGTGPAGERGVGSSVIEGLVLGHLPVFASAWGTQYAKHVAQSSGEPVALLRFTTGRASLDVYHAGTGGGLEGLVSDGHAQRTLEASIALASELSPRWIIRLPDATEPELVDASVDFVTLLTGADEAAVVASYRTLKGLAGDGSQEREPRHAWRLAVMGADPVKANEAGQKVRRAVETFLGSELEMVPCIARIGSLRSALVFDAPTAMGWREAIAAIRRAPQRPDPRDPSSLRPAPTNRHPASSDAAPTPPPTAPTAPTASTPPTSFAPPARGVTGGTIDAGVKGAGFTPMTFTHVPARSVGSPMQGRGLPRYEQRPGTAERATEGAARGVVNGVGGGVAGDDSARNASNESGAPGWLPGLRVSKAKCPFVGHIELATDEGGALHLIARDGVTSSVQDLYTVAAWAREHEALLRLADGAIRDASAITLHVLTTTPSAHRRLLDTEVRVHAMARAGSAWAVIDLN